MVNFVLFKLQSVSRSQILYRCWIIFPIIDIFEKSILYLNGNVLWKQTCVVLFLLRHHLYNDIMSLLLMSTWWYISWFLRLYLHVLDQSSHSQNRTTKTIIFFNIYSFSQILPQNENGILALLWYEKLY